MLTDITCMQASPKRAPNEFFPKTRAAAKRTTIILEPEERNYIDGLIREGKEAGIKPLISKMLEIYRDMMVCDWRFPGEYYCGISRMAFVNVEILSILIQQVPKDRWREVGRKMGTAIRVSMETTLAIAAVTRDNWELAFRRLRIQGFGDVFTKDKYLLVKTPFINEPEILGGTLEGLLGVELDLKNTVPPLVFEVRKTLADSAKQ